METIGLAETANAKNKVDSNDAENIFGGGTLTKVGGCGERVGLTILLG